jgi:hypothetical protein
MAVSVSTMRTMRAPRAPARPSASRPARPAPASIATTPRLARPSLLAAPAPARPRPSVLMRHGDDFDEGPLPLLRLPRRSEDPLDPKLLHPTPLLGGRTVGEELSLLQESYKGAEAKARKAMEERLYTSDRGGAWDGDVYVGRPGEKYDIMQLLALVAFVTPVVGLGIAMATWGTYWGNYTG